MTPGRGSDDTPVAGDADVGGTVSLAALPVAVLLTGGGRILDANPQALRLLGGARGQDLAGRLLAEVLVQGEPLGGDPATADGTEWRHGVVRPVVGGAVPVLVAAGGDRGDSDSHALVLIPAGQRGACGDSDLTLESRGRIAEVFANLAHEMRTPLNAVIGFGEILLGEHFGPLADRYKHYARDIVGAGYHLLALVNGALDLGRASAGTASLEERPVELRAVLASALAMVEPAGAAKAIATDVEDLAGLPLVYADETRMRQLFVNLIGNAIKYSPRGRPVLVRHRLDDNGDIRIEVIDAGVGMTKDEIGVAMLPFGRTDSAIRSGEAGTGLGLPISKAIVESHGGRLTIESAPRRGTTVAVVLPANRLVAAPGFGGLLSLL